MTISALYPPLTAFSAFGTGLNNTAHNVANVATNNFKAGRVTYSDLAHESGVRAQGPQTMDIQGPLVPYGPGLPPPPGAGSGLPEGFVEGSTTDIVTEMSNLVILPRSYQANIKTVQTADTLLGMVIDMKV